MDYYTGLLNAVERSVHLHGLFTTSGTVAKYKWPMKWKTKDFLPIMTSLVSLLKRSGNFSTPASSVAKRRQRLWRTISLLINPTNAGNKLIVKRHTM